MTAHWRNAALTVLVLSASACTNRIAEPPRAIPETWQTWVGGGIRLRFPEDCQVVRRGVDPEEMNLLVTKRSDPNKLILCIRLGNLLRFPTLKGLQDAQVRSLPTRIGKLKADRMGPALQGERYSSECLIDLGKKHKYSQLHAYYALLEPMDQDAAETILASIQLL